MSTQGTEQAFLPILPTGRGPASSSRPSISPGPHRLAMDKIVDHRQEVRSNAQVGYWGLLRYDVRALA
jgi:hypothetical protein